MRFWRQDAPLLDNKNSRMVTKNISQVSLRQFPPLAMTHAIAFDIIVQKAHCNKLLVSKRNIGNEGGGKIRSSLNMRVVVLCINLMGWTAIPRIFVTNFCSPELSAVCEDIRIIIGAGVWQNFLACVGSKADDKNWIRSVSFKSFKLLAGLYSVPVHAGR